MLDREADHLVLPAAQQEYVDERCAAGLALEYRTYPGLDHVPLIGADSPYLDDCWPGRRHDWPENPRSPRAEASCDNGNGVPATRPQSDCSSAEVCCCVRAVEQPGTAVAAQA